MCSSPGQVSAHIAGVPRSSASFFKLNVVILGLSSITITNSDAATQVVAVTGVTTSGPNCTGTVNTVSMPQVPFLAPSNQTIHLTYPTPLVYGSCVAAEVLTAHSNTVEVDINGIVN